MSSTVCKLGQSPEHESISQAPMLHEFLLYTSCIFMEYKTVTARDSTAFAEQKDEAKA
ncbi:MULTISPECIES: hypothetical protein [unclassified Ruegeria]|uniref:hypothetical protein n=1 Tax=unclassified Ruegeria TaxID=2625375 RepID=UPI00148883C5|nr:MULTISPECIES: hypothetical protein [unclassified Ruegeria]